MVTDFLSFKLKSKLKIFNLARLDLKVELN